MPSRIDPETILTQVADLERRLRVLENTKSTPRMIDTGTQLQPDGSTTYAYDIKDGSDHLALHVDSAHDGLVFPHEHSSWRNPSTYIAVSAGAFTDTWCAYAENPAYTTIKAQAIVVIAAATTAEIRLYESVSAQATSVKSIAGPYTGYVWFEWIVPGMSSAWGDTGTSTLLFKYQARITAGVGDIKVYDPDPLIWRSERFGAANATGNPQQSP